MEIDIDEEIEIPKKKTSMCCNICYIYFTMILMVGLGVLCAYLLFGNSIFQVFYEPNIYIGIVFGIFLCGFSLSVGLKILIICFNGVYLPIYEPNS